MTDVNNTTLTEADLSEIATAQRMMNSELVEPKTVRYLPFSCSAGHIVVPAITGHTQRTYELAGTKSKYHQYIFSAVGYWIYCVLKEEVDISKSHRTLIHHQKDFFAFLEQHEINGSNKYSFLNDWTAWLTNKGLQAQASRPIRMAIKYAVKAAAYRAQAGNDCIQYLLDILSKATTIPSSDPNPTTLGNWFAQHTWLRLDDVGIGHNAYTLFASPKALSRSLRVFSETYLSELTKWKIAFVRFAEETILPSKDVPSDLTHGDSASTKRAVLSYLNYISERAFNHPYKSSDLSNFFGMLAFCSFNNEEDIIKFRSGVPVTSVRALRLHGGDKTPSSLLFSLSFLKKLIEYASCTHKPSKEIPRSRAESLLFGWIMAGMTVQESDIPKLNRSHFSFTRNMGGATTSLQCTYYKGRANRWYTLKLVPASTARYRAIAGYINGDEFTDNLRQLPLYDHEGKNPTPQRMSAFFELAERQILPALNRSFAEEDAHPVFLSAMLALTRNGKPRRSAKRDLLSDQFVTDTLFSCSMIKTYSIYSETDTFDAARIVNHHSHATLTEKTSYLTPANQEWQNLSGRITRAVMHDLTGLLSTASRPEVEEFNDQLNKAMGEVFRRSDLTLQRLKVVTGKGNGKVNQLGILSKGPTATTVENNFSPIYILDSAETVAKLQHYLNRLSKKSGPLAKRNPEFLFYTALPTAEWIEAILKKSTFSHYDQGMELLAKYGKDFPCPFKAKLS